MDTPMVVEGLKGFEVLKLQPGDRIAVRVPRDSVIDSDQTWADQLVAQLENRWGVKAVVFVGDIELTVIRDA